MAAYMTGDSVNDEPGGGAQTRMVPVSSSTNLVKGFSKSHESLQAASKYGSMMDLAGTASTADPVVDAIDQGLAKIEENVLVAAGYVKAKLRYQQEVVHYFNKRAQLEIKHHQKMEQLCKSTEAALQEIRSQEPYNPLVDVLSSSMDVDRKVAASFSLTYGNQTTAKLIEPLEQKNDECDKMRKDYQQRWQKELRKLNDSKAALKNAHAKYRMLGNELHRVRNLLGADPFSKQAEKRKKEISELESKWEEAESSYKQAVAHCNDCQYQVHVTAQKSILFVYRRMVVDMDTVLKNGLTQYCSLQENMFRALPESLAPYKDKMVEYEIGKDFVSYINKCKPSAGEPEDFHFVEYDPTSETLDTTDTSSLTTSTSLHSNLLAPPDDTSSGRDKPSSPIQVPPQAWDREIVSLTSSPLSDRRKQRPWSVAFIQEPQSAESQRMRRSSDQYDQGMEFDEVRSKCAITHRFKRLRTPAKCRQCDTYVYFNGYECEVCGLACHNLCLESLMIECGNKKLQKKMPIFGVDLQEYLRTIKRNIPIVVTKCINELDKRGLGVQGVYRISSAKSKLEKLCQLFESGSERVDLSDVAPHLIGSCLKFYFRQLPEPVLTFDLYHEFIAFAKEASPYLPCDFSKASPEKATMATEMVQRLKALLQKLPLQNYCSVARLLYHLNRVGNRENSKVNFMPPSNLGIVFGPNLLRQREMVASLALLADMTVQAKAIEILICHVSDVCPLSEDKLREMEMEQTSTIVYGENEMSVDVTSPTDPGLTLQLGERDEAPVLGAPTTPPERKKFEDVRQMASSPSQTTPPGSQSGSFNYANVTSPSNHGTQARRSYNSIPPLEPVFERQLENEDSYDLETESSLCGEEVVGPGSHAPHSSASLFGYATFDSLNEYDTSDSYGLVNSIRRPGGSLDAPGTGFRRNNGLLQGRRHLSCSVGALDRIVEPPISMEFQEVLNMMKPRPRSSSSEGEEDNADTSDSVTAPCEPDSVPASPASFSLHSSEEGTPVHHETVARRRSSESVLVGGQLHKERVRPLSSGFADRERLTVSATSSPLGSMRKKASSSSEEHIVLPGKKLTVPSKYSRYERSSLPPEGDVLPDNAFYYQNTVSSIDDRDIVPSPDIQAAVPMDNQSTVSVDNQSTVSVDNQSTVSMDNQSAVSIDDQAAVSIDDQAAVSIDDQAAVSFSEVLISNDDTPPLPDDSASRPFRVHSLFHGHDLGSSPVMISTGIVKKQSLFDEQSLSDKEELLKDTTLACDQACDQGLTVPHTTPTSDQTIPVVTKEGSDQLRGNFVVVSGQPSTVVNLPQHPMEEGQTEVLRNQAVSVRSPDQDIRSPDQDVRSPDQDVRSPDQDVRSPDQDVRSPDQEVSVRSHDQDVMSPDQEVSVRSPECISLAQQTCVQSDQSTMTVGAERAELSFTIESTQTGKSDEVLTAVQDTRLTIEANDIKTMETDRQEADRLVWSDAIPTTPQSFTEPLTITTSSPFNRTSVSRSPTVRIRTLKATPPSPTSDYTPEEKRAMQRSRIRMVSPEEVRPPLDEAANMKRSHTHESFVNSLSTGSDSHHGHTQSNKRITVMSIKQSSSPLTSSPRTSSPLSPTVVVAVDSRRKPGVEPDVGRDKDKPSPRTRRKRIPHFV